MKVALVGLGVIGKVHLAVLKELGADIVAVCDILPERCEGTGAAVYTDYEEMLAAEKPDAVHICTPHYLHADMVVRALELSINVLCEKPLCIKNEDIARVLEAERKSSAQLGVCLQNRYNASSVFVKDRVRLPPLAPRRRLLRERRLARQMGDRGRRSAHQSGDTHHRSSGMDMRRT